MKLILKHSLLVGFLLVGLFPLKAQHIDDQLWIDVNYDVRFTKKLTLNTEAALRVARIDPNGLKVFFDPSLEYELFKNFEVGMGYRATKMPNDTPDGEQRFSSFFSYKVEFGDFDLSYRFKYQKDFPNTGTPMPQLRNRLKLGYKINKKWSAYAGSEIFYDNQETQKEFEQLRIIGGAELDLPNGKSITLYYILRQKFNVKDPGNINVLGLSFDVGNYKKYKKDKND